MTPTVTLGEKLAGYIETALASPEVRECTRSYCSYIIADQTVRCCAKGLIYVGEAMERGLTPKGASLERYDYSRYFPDCLNDLAKRINCKPAVFDKIETLHNYHQVPARKIAQRLRSGEISVQ